VDAPEVLDDRLRRVLAERYADPPRAYHDLGHARVVAERAAELGGDRACLLAAWFHDAVHVPGAPDNEERSARLLLDVLGEDDPDAARAAALVRMTADHRPDPADEQAAVLSDADLAVLGGDAREYDEYRRRVRREYGHVDDEGWADGRAAVLRDLLARPHLFATPTGRARWESRARRNLAAELADLARSGA
jgi:predicted metal-dependent HD superfamily phosphohydrolase